MFDLPLLPIEKRGYAMSLTRLFGSSRPGVSRHYDDRTKTIEFALITTVMAIITLGAFHMIGVNPVRIVAGALSLF
jgi:hypothetical protein